MLLTPTEVSEQLRVSTRTLRRWAEEGRIERVRLSYRISRYTGESVAALCSPDNEQSPRLRGGGSAKPDDHGVHAEAYSG